MDTGKPTADLQLFENLTVVDKKTLCKTLSVSQKTIERWQEGSDLPWFKIGRCCRYNVKDVQAWLEKRRKP